MNKGLTRFSGLALAAVVFASCSNFFPFAEANAAKGGEGTLWISLGGVGTRTGAARSILPQAHHFSLELVKDGGTPTISYADLGSLAFPVTLATGDWTIGIESWDSGGLALYSGSASVTIAPGPNVAQVLMTEAPMTQTPVTGRGSLCATYSWPYDTSRAAFPVYVEDVAFSLRSLEAPGVELAGTSGVTVTKDFDVAGYRISGMAQIEVLSLQSGDYSLTLELISPGGLRSNYGEVVQIYDGRLSSKTTRLGHDDMRMDFLSPTNLRLDDPDGTYLMWNAIIGAIGYNVTYNGTTIYVPYSSIPMDQPALGDMLSVSALFEDGESLPTNYGPYIPIISFSLSPSELTLSLSSPTPVQLAPLIDPLDATIQNVTSWFSNDPAIATVDQQGGVVPVGEGTTWIYASIPFQPPANCTVTVVP